MQENQEWELKLDLQVEEWELEPTQEQIQETKQFSASFQYNSKISNSEGMHTKNQKASGFKLYPPHTARDNTFKSNSDNHEHSPQEAFFSEDLKKRIKAALAASRLIGEALAEFSERTKSPVKLKDYFKYSKIDPNSKVIKEAIQALEQEIKLRSIKTKVLEITDGLKKTQSELSQTINLLLGNLNNKTNYMPLEEVFFSHHKGLSPSNLTIEYIEENPSRTPQPFQIDANDPIVILIRDMIKVYIDNAEEFKTKSMNIHVKIDRMTGEISVTCSDDGPLWRNPTLPSHGKIKHVEYSNSKDTYDQGCKGKWGYGLQFIMQNCAKIGWDCYYRDVTTEIPGKNGCKEFILNVKLPRNTKNNKESLSPEGKLLLYKGIIHNIKNQLYSYFNQLKLKLPELEIECQNIRKFFPHSAILKRQKDTLFLIDSCRILSPKIKQTLEAFETIFPPSTWSEEEQLLLKDTKYNTDHLDILIVEDDYFNKLALENAIKNFEWVNDKVNIRTASNAEDALKIVESLNKDTTLICYLDFDLGKQSINGLKLATEIKRARQNAAPTLCYGMSAGDEFMSKEANDLFDGIPLINKALNKPSPNEAIKKTIPPNYLTPAKEFTLKIEASCTISCRM